MSIQATPTKYEPSNQSKILFNQWMNKNEWKYKIPHYLDLKTPQRQE